MECQIARFQISRPWKGTAITLCFCIKGPVARDISIYTCRHGKCIPFEYDRSISHQGTPCDVLYEQGVTYVYLSSRRAEGSLPRYIDIFDETNLFFNVSVPARCLTEARKVLCHYFLPTCGNMTTFEPPTSVCEDVCERLRNLCPLEFNQLSLYFKSNSKILAPLGVTMINCSNTGEYIDPLHHCCSDLNIDIRKFLIFHLHLLLSDIFNLSLHKIKQFWSFGARP